MQRSFSARLEALERLEVEQSHGPLSEQDIVCLLTQIAYSNVGLVDGRAVRQWRCNGDEETEHMDAALVRLGAALALTSDPPRTTAELVAVLECCVPEAAVPRWVWGILDTKFPIDEGVAYEEL
jgi:hypothetical protein